MKRLTTFATPENGIATVKYGVVVLRIVSVLVVLVVLCVKMEMSGLLELLE